MLTYRDFAPTCFDRAIPFDDDRDSWYVAPISQTRDSGALSRSNFKALEDMLENAGLVYENHRFGHWGPGWFEILIIKPSENARAFLEGVIKGLEDYPVLDEGAMYEEEAEEAGDAWRFLDMRSRIRMVKEAGLSIFAARREDPPSDCYPFLLSDY